jgi:hypothetical protein
MIFKKYFNLKKMSKAEFNEYETNIQVDNQDYLNEEWTDWNNQFEKEFEPVMNNEREYFEDLCKRVSTVLVKRWLTLEDIYNFFERYDTRASISMAIGKLDKDHKVLFFRNKFSIKI